MALLLSAGARHSDRCRLVYAQSLTAIRRTYVCGHVNGTRLERILAVPLQLLLANIRLKLYPPHVTIHIRSRCQPQFCVECTATTVLLLIIVW